MLLLGQLNQNDWSRCSDKYQLNEHHLGAYPVFFAQINYKGSVATNYNLKVAIITMIVSPRCEKMLDTRHMST